MVDTIKVVGPPLEGFPDDGPQGRAVTDTSDPDDAFAPVHTSLFS